jgi:3-methyladenine DNA glycosylase AlkD
MAKGPSAAAVKSAVAELSNPERAVFLQRFFRTGAGEYAEGDKMLGLSVPQQRSIVREFRDLPLVEIQKLLDSPYHEHRLIGLLMLVDQHGRADTRLQKELHRFYVKNLASVNNWDLVDTSAATLVGEHIAGNAGLLRRLTRSKNLWHRRVAIVSTFAELRAGRTALTFQVSEELLGDPHDLIHKAVGWLLREAGKREPEDLLEFLRKHYDRLPRTTLRYAIERLDVSERKKWLSGAQ